MSDEEVWTIRDEYDRAFYSAAIGAGDVRPLGILAVVTAASSRTPRTPTYRAETCACVHDCDEDRATACSRSGDWHVHPGEPCPVHPYAAGDYEEDDRIYVGRHRADDRTVPAIVERVR